MRSGAKGATEEGADPPLQPGSIIAWQSFVPFSYLQQLSLLFLLLFSQENWLWKRIRPHPPPSIYPPPLFRRGRKADEVPQPLQQLLDHSSNSSCS